MKKNKRSQSLGQAERERREFLKKFGRFAVATPPLMTAVLSAPASADTWQSGGHHHHQRCHEDDRCKGHGGWDGGWDDW
jgi:hypothetical protein